MSRRMPPCETAIEAGIPGSTRFRHIGLLPTAVVVSLCTLFFHSALAGGLVAAPDVSLELAELAETGAISQVTELSNRRRLTTFFTNEQSPFYGVQLNYVNVGLGNLTFLNRDLVRADRVPIVFGRVYDSRRTTGADFGPGWKLSIVEFIQLRGSSLLYTDASGSEYELMIDGGRVFSEYPHLTGITDGHLRGNAIELRHSGLQKRFERAEGGYRLVEVRDHAGGSIRLRYKAGLVERISTSHQRFVDLIRDGNGRIVAAQDDAGRRTTYEYDAKGRLAIVTDLGGQRWQIGYDSQGFLAHVTDPRGAAALQATFDGAGRVQQVRVLFDSTSFDYQSGQTTVSNAMQQSAVFWHESSGLTRAVKDFAGELTEIEFDDRLQPVSLSFNGARIADLTYDSDRRLHAVSDRLDESSPRTIFEYDASGRLLSVSRDGTSIKRYRYDSLGNVISATDEDGERTYTYQVNRLQSIKVGKSLLELNTNDLGQLTRFASTEQQVLIDYDRQDRVQSLRSTMKGIKTQSRYAYGTQGLRTRGAYTFRTDASAKASAKRMEATLALTYDAVGNLTGVHEEAEGKTLLSQSYLLGDKNQLQRLTTNGRPMDYEYDAAGRVSHIRVDGRVVTFEYDALGRLAGTSLNGRQLVTSDYSPMDVDVAAEADGYSPFTAIGAPIASAVFASLEAISYARPRGTPFGPIRFDATMARFILAKSLMPAPDAVLLASLKRRALPIGSGGHHDYGNKDYGSKQPTLVNLAPIGFDKPSNGLFLPAEFSSLNCYQCYAYVSPAIVMAVNGSTAGVVPAMVGQPVSVETYDPTAESGCIYPMELYCDPEGCTWWYHHLPPDLYTAYGDGTSESGLLQYFPGEGSLHTYLAPGQYTVETVAACNGCPGAPYTCAACPGAQFIQVAAAAVKVCFAPTNYSQVQSCPSLRQSNATYVLEGCNSPFGDDPAGHTPNLGLEPTRFGINQGHIAPGNESQISSLPCSRHDQCYGTCGSSKATCDNQFETSLMNVCRAAFPEHFNGSNSCPTRFSGAPLTCNQWASQALSCEDWAENYAALPRAIGDPWYRDAQVRHCTCCP
jgi:YD repeat-containing protein